MAILDCPFVMATLLKRSNKINFFRKRYKISLWVCTFGLVFKTVCLQAALLHAARYIDLELAVCHSSSLETAAPGLDIGKVSNSKLRIVKLRIFAKLCKQI